MVEEGVGAVDLTNQETSVNTTTLAVVETLVVLVVVVMVVATGEEDTAVAAVDMAKSKYILWIKKIMCPLTILHSASGGSYGNSGRGYQQRGQSKTSWF